ncbi:hypothetical protein HDU77_011738, partial [Chytriomyces hyalinus]
GRNWKDDGSLDILIESLSDYGNYNRWKGGHGQTGETKDNLAEEIAAKLAQHGKLDQPSSRPLLTSDNLMDDSSDSSSKENETSDSSQSKVIATPSPKVPTIASPRHSKTANQPLVKSRLSALDADRVAAIKAQQEIARRQQETAERNERLEQDRFALEKERAAREEALHHIEVERAKLSVEKEKLQAMLERVQTRHQMKTMLTKSRLDELFPELASDEENL